MAFWQKAAVAAGAFLIMSAGSAFAEGWVGGVRGGALTDIDFDDSAYLAGAFIGYDYADDQDFFDGNWRLQGEFAFSSKDNGASVEYYNLTLAAYREFATGGSIRPYLVLGVGGAHVDVDTPFGGGASSTYFNLPVGGGLAIDIARDWAIDLDYRVNFIQANTDFFEVVETSEISAYLRYTFGPR